MLEAKIYKDSDGFFVAEVDGRQITKQNNIVQASKKLYRYLVSQS